MFVLQLQNDLASLRYFLFSSAGTLPVSDTYVKNPATSPPSNTNPNTEFNLNPNPTSNALLLLRADKSSVRRTTPEGGLGPLRAKQSTLQTSIFWVQPPNAMPL